MNPSLKPSQQPPQPPPRPLQRLARLRKVYVSEREFRRDRRLGVIAFVLVNLFAWLAFTWLSTPGNLLPALDPRWPRWYVWVELIPWLANGLVLLLAFVFRPQIAIGFLACITGLLLLGVGLFTVLVASCIVSIPVIMLLPPLGVIVFFVLAVVGTIWLLPKLYAGFQEWWRKP